MLTQIITDGTKLLDTGNANGLLDTAPLATTLAAAVTTLVQTAWTVTSGAGIVNGNFITVLLETTNTTETVLVTAGGGTVNLTVVRAQFGTVASLHSNAATVNVLGKLIYQLLSIAQAPNIPVTVYKTSADANYVEIRAGGANTFPGGGTRVILYDNATNGLARIKIPGSGNVLLYQAASAGLQGIPGVAGPAAPTPADVTITSFTVQQVVSRDGSFAPIFQLAVTPPGGWIGIGCHLYLEFPDQSATSTAVVGSAVIGTDAIQGPWTPLDLGLFPYVAAQQPWTFPVPPDFSGVIQVRVYAAAYSAAIDNALVRAGLGGATPNATLTLAVSARPKPGSGSDVSPLIITAVSASVLAAVSVGGKLRRPIAVGVDLSGLGSGSLPPYWRYQLLGYKDNDLTQAPLLASGQYSDPYTTANPAPAGPDGISVAHTFGPEEPTALTNITIYAVAGLMEVPGVGRKSLRVGEHSLFVANNIVPGVTASVNIQIGTTTGVTDPTKFLQANLSPVFGNVASLFDIVPQAIDSTRQGLLAINSINLIGLAVTNPKLAALAVTAGILANSSVTAVAIASLAVGTAAIQNGAITNALIANLAVGTANIQALAVTDAQIGNLSVTKLLAGVIAVAVSLTAPTITITSGTVTINLDGTNYFKVFDSSQNNTLAVNNNNFSIRHTGDSRAAVVTLQQFSVTDAAGTTTCSISPGALNINGVQVHGPRLGTRPVTLADVISAGVTQGWWV